MNGPPHHPGRLHRVRAFGKWSWLVLAAAALAAGAAFWALRAPGPEVAGPPGPGPWFVDVTDEVGLDFLHDAGPVGDYFMPQQMGSGAAFLDFDNDGRLDLVLVCYVDYDPTWPCTGPAGKRDFCAPNTFRGRVSRLFHNQSGPSAEGPVRFEDATVRSGLGRVPGPGLGVVCADFDGDGWPDIFVANDGAPNRLWINRHDGTFADEALLRGIACDGRGRAMAGMGIAFGDADGDGLLDAFVTHLGEETHTLWRQSPRGLFLDGTARAGLLDSHWRGTGFGTLFGDFDCDGHLDLAVVNGRVAPARAPATGRWARSGAATRSATSCSPTTARGASKTCPLRTPPCVGR